MRPLVLNPSFRWFVKITRNRQFDANLQPIFMIKSDRITWNEMLFVNSYASVITFIFIHIHFNWLKEHPIDLWRFEWMNERKELVHILLNVLLTSDTSNGSWCMGIKGEMSGTVCVTFTWDMYIYIWVVYSLCFFCCLFITVTWWYVWCILLSGRASGNQDEVQACLVTLWLFIISCYSLYKTTLGLLCSWFENNPHFHKYSMDFHV